MNRRFLFGLVGGLSLVLGPGRARADGPAAIIYGGKIIQTGHGDAYSQQERDYEQGLHLSTPELRNGNNAYSAGHYEDAIAFYAKAIAYDNWGDLAHPYNSGPNYNYLAYSDRGLAERALGNVKRNLGDLKAAQDNFKKAAADFTKAIDINSTYAFAFNQLGEIKRDDGDLSGALDKFHKAVTYDPKSATALFNLANTEQRENDFSDAVFHYGRLAELTPQDAQAYFHIGVAKEAMKDNEGAIASYTKSIALDPFATDYARFYLALALRRFYRDETPAGLARVVPLWPGSWEKSVGRYLLGELSDKDFLAAAAVGGPKEANEHSCSANYFAGMTHLLKGDSAAAREFFTKALGTKAADLNEYDLARTELARLTGKFAAVN